MSESLPIDRRRREYKGLPTRLRGNPRTDASVVEGSLTRRERDVMALVADGLPNKEIAEILGVRPDTVRTHRSNALRRLHVRTTAAAVAILLRRGEIL